jgi:hypothetical protein
MKVTVGTRLQMLVTEALMQARTPLRTSEVAQITGRSVTAVKAALEASRAERVPGVAPTEWVLPDTPAAGPMRVPSKHDGIEFTVSTKTADGIVEIWNKQRDSVGKSLQELEITPTLDPKKAAMQIGTLAGSLAALAYTLAGVQGMPDWYEIITEKE